MSIVVYVPPGIDPGVSGGYAFTFAAAFLTAGGNIETSDIHGQPFDARVARQSAIDGGDPTGRFLVNDPSVLAVLRRAVAQGQLNDA